LGFTVIEVMTVIAIIAVLAGLLVIAIGKLQVSAKRHQTVQILENCRAMFAEYDSAKRPHFNTIDPIPAPANVTTELNPSGVYSQYGRYGDAAQFTRAYMNLFRAMPINAAALAKMSPDSLMRISFTLPNPSPWTAGPFYKAYDIAGGRVYDPNDPSKPIYLCIQTIPTSSAANEPPNTDYWLPEPTDLTIPVPLDAWGNPILFVPWGLGSAKPIGQLGTMVAGGNSITMTSAGPYYSTDHSSHRPFFASAGPDGDFSKGDDNIYSFEK
jgi:prepilin-type N-terminal cleavage/methylation domain-containing protein